MSLNYLKSVNRAKINKVYRDGGFWLGVWILISIALGILGFFAKPLTYAAMMIVALTMRLFQ
jgi:hypothetical protein